jgi:hypothetical protein
MHTTRSDFRILIASLLTDSMLAVVKEDFRRIPLAALSNNIFIPPASRQGNGSHQL